MKTGIILSDRSNLKDKMTVFTASDGDAENTMLSTIPKKTTQYLAAISGEYLMF